jgi:hypothetical protein
VKAGGHFFEYNCLKKMTDRYGQIINKNKQKEFKKLVLNRRAVNLIALVFSFDACQHQSGISLIFVKADIFDYSISSNH